MIRRVASIAVSALSLLVRFAAMALRAVELNIRGVESCSAVAQLDNMIAIDNLQDTESTIAFVLGVLAHAATLSDDRQDELIPFPIIGRIAPFLHARRLRRIVAGCQAIAAMDDAGAVAVRTIADVRPSSASVAALTNHWRGNFGR